MEGQGAAPGLPHMAAPGLGGAGFGYGGPPAVLPVPMNLGGQQGVPLYGGGGPAKRGAGPPHAQLPAPNQYSGPLGRMTWEIGPRDILQVASEQRARINRCLALPYNPAGWRDKIANFFWANVLLTMSSQSLQVLPVFGMTTYQDPHPQPSLLSGRHMAFLGNGSGPTATTLNVADDPRLLGSLIARTTLEDAAYGQLFAAPPALMPPSIRNTPNREVIVSP